MPAFYDRYANVMRQLDYGYALWHPDPFDQYDMVRAGDVGSINGGKFSPGWPLWREDTVLAGHTRINHINAEKPLRTESILEVGVGVSLATTFPSHEAGIGVTYKCVSAKGGLIALKDGFAISEDLDKVRERDLAEHLRLNSTLILERCGIIDLDDLVAITGTSITGDWDNFFYETSNRMVQATLDSGILSDAVLAKTHLVIKHSLGQSIRQSSGHHHQQDQTRRLVHTSTQESCCGEVKNQTIFIRTLRMRKRKFKKSAKVIRAAAEPKGFGGDFSGATDGAVVSIDSDESLSDAERDLVVTSDDHPDTKSKGLYDELFDYLFQNSEADVVLVHDRDIDYMLKKRTQDPNVKLRVAEKFSDGVAVLYHESNPLIADTWDLDHLDYLSTRATYNPSPPVGSSQSVKKTSKENHGKAPSCVPCQQRKISCDIKANDTACNNCIRRAGVCIPGASISRDRTVTESHPDLETRPTTSSQDPVSQIEALKSRLRDLEASGHSLSAQANDRNSQEELTDPAGQPFWESKAKKSLLEREKGPTSRKQALLARIDALERRMRELEVSIPLPSAQEARDLNNLDELAELSRRLALTGRDEVKALSRKESRSVQQQAFPAIGADSDDDDYVLIDPEGMELTDH